MDKRQVKAIIKLLKSRAIVGRPPLQRLFEQGGYVWATDGYVAFEIGEAQPQLKGKCVPLTTLVAWNATHTHATDVLSEDEWQDNDTNPPDMVKLLHTDYDTLTEPPLLNVNFLKLACDFLGIESVSLERNSNNTNCYRIKPLNEYEMDILTRALESRAYVMGLHK